MTGAYPRTSRNTAGTCNVPLRNCLNFVLLMRVFFLGFGLTLLLIMIYFNRKIDLRVFFDTETKSTAEMISILAKKGGMK